MTFPWKKKKKGKYFERSNNDFFSDFIGLNNNIIIGTNCCGRSGWILILSGGCC